MRQATREAEPDACAGVVEASLGPGWLAGPLVSAAGTASSSFEAVPGSYGVVVLHNGDASGQDQLASASLRLNGAGVLSIAAGTPLAAAVVQLEAVNALELTGVGAGTARAGVADASAPPCSQLSFTATRVAGGPQVATQTFSLPLLENAVLLIRNNTGPNNGAAAGVTGKVSYNGALVAGRSQLRPGSPPVAVAVELRAANTVDVLFEGAPAAGVEVSVFDADLFGPTVELTQPAEGGVFSASPLHVEGTASADAVSVEVGGAPASLAGGVFTADVPLVPGANAIVAAARDQCGAVSRDCRVVALDLQPPVISIEGVTDGEVTAGNLTISWTALDEHLASSSATLDGAGFESGGTVTAEGDHTLVVTAVDRGGLVSTATVHFAIDRTAPAIAIAGVQEGQCYPSPPVPTVTATDPHLGNITAQLDGSPYAAGTPVTADGLHLLEVTAVDLAGNESVAARMFTVDQAEGCGLAELPPDPATVAPPIDPTVATGFFEANEFLYAGTPPIQTGVAPGTIEPRRAAVLRGRVLDRDGAPVPGVGISVLDHPELGQTRSRADGVFDLAVNGGGPLTVRYEKAGLLEVQRTKDAPWQQFTWLPDVVMIPLDPAVTVVDFSGAGGTQIARGSVVTDEDGTRQATLLFRPGTTATMILADGSTASLPTASVRATEYTVGPRGPEAMPAELPPTTQYTYAVELSADEALAAGASSVEFSQPVRLYFENFLGFEAGVVVPVGLYDRACGCWVPSDDGRVIAVLSVTGGLADLDTDGDGAADPPEVLAAQGIDDAERAELGRLYPPGTSLWRSLLPHFTPADHNMRWRLSRRTEVGPPRARRPEEDPCNCAGGSWTGCESQKLGEDVPVAGTPFRLVYGSERVEGRTAVLDVQVSGATLFPNLQALRLVVEVGGQRIEREFPPLADQTYRFTWDGNDAYGRRLQGAQRVTASVGSVYDFSMYSAELGDPARVFGLFPRYGDGGTTYVRWELTQWNQASTFVGTYRAAEPGAQGLAGWMLDVHHAYDANDRTLYLGNGEHRRADSVALSVIETFAGTNCDNVDPDVGDGRPATEAHIISPKGVAVAPDGSVIIADTYHHRVRRVAPSGTIETIAGTGDYGFSGDGGPAVDAQLAYPWDVAVVSDGSIVVSDSNNNRVRRISPDGTISTLAGGGTRFGDGGPATEASLSIPVGLDVGPDCTVFVAEYGRGRVRRITADGYISTAAGGGSLVPADGLYWDQVRLRLVRDVAAAHDGSLLISSSWDGLVFRIEPDGILSVVAGGGNAYPGDGAPATNARIYPQGLTVTPDGGFLFADDAFHWVRHVDPLGIISTPAGSGDYDYMRVVDGVPAAAAMLWAPNDVALGPDGYLYIADTNYCRIRRVRPAFPEARLGDVAVAAKDGSELYVFDGAGRHLRTIDPLSGAAKYTFAYDAAGRLSGVTDRDGDETAIERDLGGRPTAIVGPFGQRTELSVGADGYLETITNPASEAWTFTYHPGGLLASAENPRGMSSSYEYDDAGMLLSVKDAAQGHKTLSRTELAEGYRVDVRSPLGRTMKYQVEDRSDGSKVRTVVSPDLLVSSTQKLPKGVTTSTSPDGTTTTSVLGPDPRFGMLAPLVTSSVTRTPAGRQRSVTATRDVTLADSADLSSLVTLIDAVAVNGREYRIAYDAGSRTTTTTSPAGRSSTATLDPLGRVTSVAIPGVLPLALAYDERGRLESVTQGSRTSALGYGGDGFAESFTDPLLRTATFGRDAVGRITSELLPGSRTVGLGYDAAGNLTSVTPPGRPAHGFTYTPVNQLDSYDPPALDAGAWSTDYATDLDRQLDYAALPDGELVDLSYEPSGRLDYLTTSHGTLDVAYDSAGRVQRLTAPAAVTTTYSYDGPLPTATVWTGPVTGTVTRTYDNDLRVRTVGVNGSNVTYTYDADKLLTSVSGAANMTIARDPANGFVTGTTAGVVTTTTTYTPYGEVASFVARVSGAPRYAYVLERDDGGRITRKTDTILGVTTVFDYAYDEAGRLADVWADGALTAHYEYDANGNRLSRTDGAGAATAGAYDDQDRLVSYGAATYTFGRRGDLQRKEEPGALPLTTQTTTYDYDAFGNLQGATLPGGAVLAYVVDGQNRRIGKRVNGALRQGFLYDGQLRVVAELGGTNQVVGRFVYATRANVPDLMIRSGVHRVLSDHLGSPRLVVNVATGAIAQRLDYDEWGAVLADTNPGWQPFGFAGGVYDRDLALTRFGARDYDGHSGRWTSKDPVFSRSLSLYAYVNNDPATAIDPSGRVLIVAVGAVVGGYGLYLYDAARDIRFDAEMLTGNQGLVPGVGGEGDAFRHCLASCMVAREFGRPQAAIAGWGNELAHLDDNTPAERGMDLDNNAVGRNLGCCGSGATDCVNSCLSALRGGQLVVIHPGPNQPLPSATYSN